jgi:hypothetical protein
MPATTRSVQALRAYASRFKDSRLNERSNSIQLVIDKADISITVTVPFHVCEWYVEAKENRTGLEASDWYDYAGYESAGTSDLDSAMAADLSRFLGHILEHPLRMRQSGDKAQAALDWHVDNAWRQCVPARV